MVKLSNLHKIGKYNKENRGKFGEIINKIGNFHIVNIDTESHLNNFQRS